MKRLNNSGFTIIETMLFLAITGALIASLLIGVGGSINAQRYRDSVVSLQSILQKQYSEVANVNNVATGACASASGVSRGQSDCVIIGRYITTNNDQKLTIKTVFLNKMPNTTAGHDDIAALTTDDSTLTFNILGNGETYDAEWGVSFIPPRFSILIIQSPSSGMIRTFINPNALVTDDNIKSLVAVGYLASTSSVEICVQPNGLSGGKPSAVIVNAGSANASGVETKGEANGCS